VNPLAEEKERDKELFKEIQRMYKEEDDRTQILNDKSISIATSAGTIMTLFVGLSTFSLEHITAQNPYFLLILLVLITGLMVFVITIVYCFSNYSPKGYLSPDPQ
jgi:hypothetical protein